MTIPKLDHFALARKTTKSSSLRSSVAAKIIQETRYMRPTQRAAHYETPMGISLSSMISSTTTAIRGTVLQKLLKRLHRDKG